MSKGKLRNGVIDFKLAKLIAMFFRFFGCIASAYFAIQTVLQLIASLEKNQVMGIILFSVLFLFFLYLTIVLGRQGTQVIKAKKISDLP